MLFMLFILGKPNIAPDPASCLGYACLAQGVREVQDTHDCLAGRAKPRGLGELACHFTCVVDRAGASHSWLWAWKVEKTGLCVRKYKHINVFC